MPALSPLPQHATGLINGSEHFLPYCPCDSTALAESFYDSHRRAQQPPFRLATGHDLRNWPL